jgi:putative ABC transport system substrate-binding protein
MRRRKFLTSFCASMLAWPGAVRAQQQVHAIGFLSSLSESQSKHLVTSFHRGLAANGFAVGQNVAIEYRWADGRYSRLPALAVELVERKVQLLVASGGPPSALAAKAATATIPIVFSLGVDPVKLGVVKSFNHPGANITGVYMLTTGLEAKRFGLLHELTRPGAAIAVLYNPTDSGERLVQDVRNAARAVARPLHVERVTKAEELEAAYASIVAHKAGALLVASDPLLSILRRQIVALSARHAIPAAYQIREFVEAGGLMSYGTNLADAYREVGVYAGRILKGAQPADLPVMQSTRFEFVINLKTAKALGVTFPPGLLAIADEVIE